MKRHSPVQARNRKALLKVNSHDVFSFGVVSSSTLYGIQGKFPGPEGYAEIGDVRHMTGGEATNSSIVLAALGARVKLDGNWVGDDDNGKRTKALLAGYDIDTSRLPLREGYSGVQEVVFAAQDTRTIFGTYCQLQEDAAWNDPHEDDVTRAKAICLDPFFKAASYKAAETGARAGIPVITVDCRYDDPLLKHVSAIAVAESFIRENYAGQDLQDLFRQYQQNCDGLVVFTFGAKAIWYARPGQTVNSFQPYAVDAVDTTGGGDSFRAGLVYGFLNEWTDKQMIDFAAAVAAVVCTRFPGVMNAPTYDEVAEFIRTATA